MHTVQLHHPSLGRRLARVEGSNLAVLLDYRSLLDLAVSADISGSPIRELAQGAAVEQVLAYDPVHAGQSDWHLLPAFDHPAEPARCIVSGTGLTHVGSASSRNRMHAITQAATTDETDSMKMFRWGMEGGKPASGVGVAPEWFYKGTGAILRAHGEPLEIPSFAESGGEESEIAGLYYVGACGEPRRIGYAIANEFSDHTFEKRNYLYLAHSKLRACSLGPEAIIGEPIPAEVTGRVSIQRAGRLLWESEIRTGEANMCHAIANLEHHHFKYDDHRRPGQAHVHYFGAAALSFSAGIRLEEGDVVTIAWDGCGRPLSNRITRQAGDPNQPVVVPSL